MKNNKKIPAAVDARRTEERSPVGTAGTPVREITGRPASPSRLTALPAVIGLLVVVFFPAPARPAEVLPLNALAVKMQQSYEKTKDLQAAFLQEVTMQSMDRIEKEEGVFYFKKPQKMVWDYQKPKKKKLVINPRDTWFYVPADRVVYLQDTKSVLKSQLIIKFLSGMGKLQDDFAINFLHTAPLDTEGHYLLRLVPKSADIGMENLSLAVDRDSFQVVEFSFSDIYGNASRIRFRNVTINNGLPDGMFTFKTPPGTEVFPMP